MRIITEKEVELVLQYPLLIDAIKEAFIKEITVPPRHHHDFWNPKEGTDSTLLLMPAWESENVGIKVATVSPNNTRHNLPGINGVYLLFDTQKGVIKAILEGKNLTAKRTAAASALASSYLSRPNSSSLLVIGTGALGGELIKAHSSTRDLKNIYLWGRDKKKAMKIKQDLSNELDIEVIDKIEDKISEVDIVSCATLSSTPLVLGQFIQKGQHVDLIGAFRPDMREGDDDLIKKANIFIDTYMAKKETGDIKIPLDQKVINEEDIKGDLFGLTRGLQKGRTSDEQITLFKSVGHALEDLAAAQLVEKILSKG